MVPGAYIHHLELPRNTNGKIDRLKLKEMLEAGRG
jgi:acyl-coenzyme A synthetase/AMP-(fatty) acid ligase